MMDESRELSVEVEVSAVEKVDRVLHPALLDRAAERASDEELQLMSSQAKGLARIAWTTWCIVVGHMTKRLVDSGTPDKAGKRLKKGILAVARATDSHNSDVSRAVAVYEKIIKPRIERDGENATFPVQGRSYYELATDAERYSGKSAAELIEVVEDRLAGGSFSVREFRQWLVDEGHVPPTERFKGNTTTEGEAKTLRDVLAVLVNTNDDAMRRMVRSEGDRGVRLVLDSYELLKGWALAVERMLESQEVEIDIEEDAIGSEP